MERLNDFLRKYDKIAIALSGGADSACLLKAAVKAIGSKNVLAITVHSEFMPDAELAMARRFGQLAGVEHMVIEVCALDNEFVAANGPKRCYYCKRAIFTEILNQAWIHGIKAVMDGTNADDTSDYRPGMEALSELGIISPFLELNMKKTDIIQLFEDTDDLSVPSYACLATRVPTGTKITLQDLERADRGETLLRSMGFSKLRVRIHGDCARLELSVDEIDKAFEMKSNISNALKSVGFRYISLDLDGYVQGNMNERRA